MVPSGPAEQVLTRIAGRDLIDIAVDKAGRRQQRDRALPAWITVYLAIDPDASPPPRRRPCRKIHAPSGNQHAQLDSDAPCARSTR
ncbi:transposase domain-containing protein [Dactylosporangium sp. NPDC005555]|uniref:transposase domain-containing protein n=1 Tax=Dactylosporangium sp. NPDC005555 TaxID=3154889 RepID=UPI0033BBBD21